MASDENSVGYRRPPQHSRFRPGQSGNPSGRPKKIRSISSELLEELSTLTTVQEAGSSVEISKQRAMLRALVRAATEGNLRAVTAVLNFCAKIPNNDEADEENSAVEAEILDAFRQKLQPNAGEEKPDTPTLPEETK